MEEVTRKESGVPENALDPDTPVRIADRIWWVGHYLPDDPFQCHVYLIENGDRSVLIDPGSKLTFHHALRKVERVVPFSHIRYFVCHHQDPDITGSLPLIDQLNTREDAVIISHWRAIALLRHYGIRMPFLCVEKAGWSLDIGGRRLTFIFTPYLHFPGAFCTYDEATGVLFSSDIFGGFTENWSLFARDEGYFEAIRPFHEHYMPSRDILYRSLVKLEQRRLELIAPQHGSIIPKRLIRFMFNQLKNIECGLYLMTQTNTDILRLSHLNRMLHRFMEKVILHREFSEVAHALCHQAKEFLPVRGLSFHARTREGKALLFDEESMYRGVLAEPPAECRDVMDMTPDQWKSRYDTDVIRLAAADEDIPNEGEARFRLALPLYSVDSPRIHALAIFDLAASVEIDGELEETLRQIGVPLSIAMEREIILRTMEMERQRFYEQAIRDPLTGLYTRVYMQEATRRLFSLHDREAAATVFALVFDIDHFKSINDTYGHNLGDTVLHEVAQAIMGETRAADIQVRLGGEEFVVFIVCPELADALETAERIRHRVSGLRFPPPMEERRCTISGGVARRRQAESLEELIQRADKALYEAKHTGRNRIRVAP